MLDGCCKMNWGLPGPDLPVLLTCSCQQPGSVNSLLPVVQAGLSVSRLLPVFHVFAVGRQFWNVVGFYWAANADTLTPLWKTSRKKRIASACATVTWEKLRTVQVCILLKELAGSKEQDLSPSTPRQSLHGVHMTLKHTGKLDKSGGKHFKSQTLNTFLWIP